VLPGRLTELPPSSFAQLAALLDPHKPGKSPLSLAVGDPQGTPPAFIAEAIAREVAGFGRYPPINGTEEWRHAAAGWLRRRFHLPETVIEAERHLLPLNGTREGLFLAPQIVTPEKKAGGRPVILIPNPFYQCYAAAALAAGAEAVFVTATEQTGFLPDFAGLPQNVLERTVAAYFCSPSNPEGACADEDYWRTLFALADRYDFTVFADECYADIYFDRPPVTALDARFRQSGNFDRLLTFHSLSKRSGLPGLRSGIVAGDPALMQTFRYLRNTAGPQVATPLLAASAAAWRDEDHVRANRATYAARFDLAQHILGNRSGFRMPQGGFFLWLDVGNGEEAALRLWREEGIRVLPGAYMGRATEPGKKQTNPGFRYIRVALVSDLVTISAALERVAEQLGGAV
jgi:aspartate/methionine/tyrosine aminotransferase